MVALPAVIFVLLAGLPDVTSRLLDGEDCPAGHPSAADLVETLPEPAGWEHVRLSKQDCAKSDLGVSEALVFADYAANSDAESAAGALLAAAGTFGWRVEFPRGGKLETQDGKAQFVLKMDRAGKQLTLTGAAYDIVAARSAGVRGPGFDAAVASGGRTWISLSVRVDSTSPFPTIKVGGLGVVPTRAPGIGR